MKNKAVMALALAAFLSVTTMADTAYAATVDAVTSATQTQEKAAKEKKEKKEEIAEPENAIGKDAAKEKALADAGVTAEQAGKVRAHLSTMDDGTVVYKVRFTYNDQRYSYRINAVTGAVAEKDSKAVTEDEQKGGRGSGQEKGTKPEKTAADAKAAE